MFKNKFHWKVGQKRFTHKHKAALESVNTGYGIEWIPPDDWVSYDWSQPPHKDLETLVLEQVIKLRQSYSRVTLWYSGGTDSQTVLDIFLKYRIKIDEIICFKSGIPKADFEIDTVAIPYLNFRKNDLRGAKISIIELTRNDILSWHQKRFWELYEGYHSHTLRPQYATAMFNFANKPKPNEINIWCSPKSYVFCADNEWYTYLPDWEMYSYFIPDVCNIYMASPDIYHRQSSDLISHVKTIDRTLWNKVTGNFDYQHEWNKGMGRHKNHRNLIQPKIFDLDGNFRRTLTINNRKQDLIEYSNKETASWSEVDQELIDQWQNNMSDLWDLKHLFNHGQPHKYLIGCPGVVYNLNTGEIHNNTHIFKDGFHPEKLSPGPAG